MVYNKYIGIIGGTGTIGSIIVKYLLQLQTHFHVLIGGRRSIKEISMSTFYNSERLKYNQMNYNNDVELDNFCSQCLLVINAVGPSFKINDKIALHAELSNTEQTNRSDGKKKQNYSLFPRSLRSLFLKRLLTYLFLPGSVPRDTKEF